MNLILSILFLFSLTLASDQIPASDQDHPILIKGATIHTVSHGTLEQAEIIFDKGKIISVGQSLTIPYGTEIIDASGQHIYPGLISAGSTLGLQEIGAVRATRDYAEVGDINPNVRAITTWNEERSLSAVI